MEDCVFCKIANGDIPSKKVYEDEDMLCFYDINPEAPVHVLFIPKKHIESINDLNEENSYIVSKIFLKMKDVAKKLGIADKGYRIISNCGEDAGQTVHHLHFHMLGGEKFKTTLL